MLNVILLFVSSLHSFLVQFLFQYFHFFYIGLSTPLLLTSRNVYIFEIKSDAHGNPPGAVKYPRPALRLTIGISVSRHRLGDLTKRSLLRV